MPKISRKPDPNLSQGLVRFIKVQLERRGVSMSSAAADIGISHSHLSDILAGKKAPDAGVCLAMAKYFNVSPIEILRLAGWLPDDT